MMWKYALLVSGLMLTATAGRADYAKGVEALQAGNYTVAAQELADAADAGDAKAQYLMGYLYYQGQGVAQDDEKAFELFRNAADKGHVEAQTFLAFMYDAGRGVPQNKKKAFELYQASADEGDITATINLGVMYYKGDGIPQNYDKAFELLNDIEHVNSPVLQLYLGNLYFYGYGVRQDVNKALDYYLRSAALGDVSAHYFLGSIYQQGKGAVRANPSEALLYYTYAAQKGDPNAQYNLATLYAGGAAGKVDKIQAYAWLVMASEQNMAEANEALEKLGDSMSLSEISQAKNYVLELQQIDPETVISPVPPMQISNSIYSTRGATTVVGNQGGAWEPVATGMVPGGASVGRAVSPSATQRTQGTQPSGRSRRMIRRR